MTATCFYSLENVGNEKTATSEGSRRDCLSSSFPPSFFIFPSLLSPSFLSSLLSSSSLSLLSSSSLFSHLPLSSLIFLSLSSLIFLSLFSHLVFVLASQVPFDYRPTRWAGTEWAAVCKPIVVLGRAKRGALCTVALFPLPYHLYSNCTISCVPMIANNSQALVVSSRRCLTFVFLSLSL